MRLIAAKSPKQKKVYFESKMGDKKISFNGIPFIIHGTLILKCAYGDQRKRKQKVNRLIMASLISKPHTGIGH